MSESKFEGSIPSAAVVQQANDDWLTSMEEIAVACGDSADEYGIRRAYRLCARGDIPAIKVAGRWRVRRAALEAHFAKLEQRAVAG